MRQRASKYALLAMLINKPNQTDENQRQTGRYIDGLLNPYNIQSTKEITESSWSELRAKRGK